MFPSLCSFIFPVPAEGKEAQGLSQERELHREAVPEAPGPGGPGAAAGVGAGGNETDRSGPDHGEGNTGPCPLVP